MGRQADRAKDGDILPKLWRNSKEYIAKSFLMILRQIWICVPKNGSPMALKDLAEQISLLPLIGAAFDLVKIGEAEKWILTKRHKSILLSAQNFTSSVYVLRQKKYGRR